ncbi:hypothetical protein BJ085DRAFT_16302, partial [Dimargaris cristalligena]
YYYYYVGVCLLCRPAVMSSKVPVSRFRNVVGPEQKKTRDPRFDTLSGKLNEELFRKSYKFVKKIESREVTQLQARVTKTRNPELKEELEEQLKKRLSKVRQDQHLDKVRELQKTVKRREREMVKQGKQPYFLKDKTFKKIQLADRFRNIKNPEVLEKLIEKRRKSNARTDERSMPFRRDVGE